MKIFVRLSLLAITLVGVGFGLGSCSVTLPQTSGVEIPDSYIFATTLRNSGSSDVVFANSICNKHELLSITYLTTLLNQPIVNYALLRLNGFRRLY